MKSFINDTLQMGLDSRKPIFGELRTTKAQTSLRIHAVWSAPMLFAYWKVSHQNFTNLASLCSWAGWFGYDLVRSPEDRFSSIVAQIRNILKIKNNNFFMVPFYMKLAIKNNVFLVKTRKSSGQLMRFWYLLHGPWCKKILFGDSERVIPKPACSATGTT